MMGDREGTQEAKRRSKAVPDPLVTTIPAGCFVLAGVYLAACTAWFLATRSATPVALAVPAVLLLVLALLMFLKGRALLARAQVSWAGRGIRCLIVHSDSPIWQEHIAERWIRRIGPRAVTLNWSERATRKGSLEFEVFRWFSGTDHNFNPAVIVFRGLRRPLVFRFFYAFHEAKVGRTQYLEQLEKQMFEALGV